MAISEKELKAVAEIVQTRNLSRAAERLATSQPALTLLIQRLELHFGVRLFTRSKRGVEPTKAALKLAEESKRFLREWEALRERVLNQETEVRGVYSIGCHPQVAAYTFPLFMPALLGTSDLLEIKWVKATSRETLASIVSYEVDFGIVVDPKPHPDLVITPLYRNTLRFWTKKKAGKLQDLSKKSLVVLCDRSLPQMENVLLEAQRRKQIPPCRIINCPDLDALRSFVAGGVGIGVLPETIAAKHSSDGLEPLEGLPTFDERICLIYRADQHKTSAAKCVRETIIKHVRRL